MRTTVVVTKSIDKAGRIVIPVDMRQAAGIEMPGAVEFLMDREKGQTVLMRASGKCMKCGGAENLKHIKSNFYLCQACLDTLK